MQRALESFLGGKAEDADAVLQTDGVVGRMKDEAFVVRVQKIHDDPSCTRQALDVLLIAGNMERVADLVTNIAEDVIFWMRGADVRQGGSHCRE